MNIKLIALSGDKAMIENSMPVPFSNKEHRFLINDVSPVCDGVIVLQSTRGYDIPGFKCRKGNALLVVYEPEDILRMPNSYIDQFDHIITPNTKIIGKHTVNSCFAQLWHMNKTYEELRFLSPAVNKIDKVSAVISTKTMTKGHMKRLAFVRALKDELGDLFDWYGKGVHEIDDKWDVLYPYKYHLAIENGVWPDYWTEKIADPLLAYSMPLYMGCPNITDYFSSKSFISLQDKSVSDAANIIRNAISNDKYSQSIEYLSAARNRIFESYGLFPMLNEFVAKNFDKDRPEWCDIKLSKFKNTVYCYYPTKAYKKFRHKITRLFR